MFRDELDAVSGLPGVRAAAVSNFTPISGGYWSQAVQVNGQTPSEEDVVFFAVSPGFFNALSIPLRMGRDFTMRDDATAPPATIVNQEFVRRFLPAGRHPLGNWFQPPIPLRSYSQAPVSDS